MRGVVGMVLRLVALLVLVTGGPIVVLGTAEAVVRHDASVTPDRDGDDDLGVLPVTVALAPGPLAQFVGRPKDRDGEGYTFDVEEVELGRWDGSDPVVVRGVSLAPWRSYRVVLMPGEDGEPRDAATVETLGVGAPAGITSLVVLPRHALLALVLAPLVVASGAFLVVSSRRQSRAEEQGVELGGLRPRSAVVAAQKRLQQLV